MTNWIVKSTELGGDKYFVSRECSLYKSPVAGKCRVYSRSRKKMQHVESTENYVV